MFLYGASGHAKVIIDILRSMNIEITGIFDDNPDCIDIKGVKFLGSVKDYEEEIDSIIISIGNNSIRRNIELSNPLFNYGTAIHSSALVSNDVEIGAGSVLMHASVVQSSVKIGRHCIINTSSSVDHDCTIGDFSHISPNSTLCGSVHVGEGVHVGAGAVVIPGITIGKWAVVGAGTVVIKDIPDYAIVVGNPGRVVGYTNQ